MQVPGFWSMLGHTLNLKNKLIFRLALTYRRIRCEIPDDLPAFSVRYMLRYVRIDKFHRSISKADT